MDVKLRSAMIDLQTTQKEAIKKLEKQATDGGLVLDLGRKIYKQAITAHPEWLSFPYWRQFRDALGIPMDALEAESDAEKDSKAAVAAVRAVDAVEKLAGFTDIAPDRKAELLAQLEQAVTNARARLVP